MEREGKKLKDEQAKKHMCEKCGKKFKRANYVKKHIANGVFNEYIVVLVDPDRTKNYSDSDSLKIKNFSIVAEKKNLMVMSNQLIFIITQFARKILSSCITCKSTYA